MGHSIAQVHAAGGFSVRLVDRDTSILDRAKKQIRLNLEVMVEAGVFAATDIDATVNRIETSADIERAADGVDLAMECVAEKTDVKRDVFSRLDRASPLRTILVSNTSTLNVFEDVSVSRPEKLCIAHWYAPPHIIPLVDVVMGPDTSQETCDLVVEMLLGLGKKPMVMRKFVPGYLMTRLQVAMAREINFLLDNGCATPQELDEAVKASIAPRMMALGLTHRMDFTGLDVSLAIQKAAAQRPLPEPSFKTLEKLVNAGHLGVKTGKGFYDYSNRTPEQILRERDLALLKVFRAVS